MNYKDESSFHIMLRSTNQRVSRRDYINLLPENLKTEITNCDYYVTPEREVLIMDLLDKFTTRVTLTKHYTKEEEVHRFVKSFKRIPDRLYVFVWSTLEYGPVYKMNLRWAINNFEKLWNEQNKYDLVIISENGKIGLMVRRSIDFDELVTTKEELSYTVTKWGLM